jgi:hypothetical protein
VRPRRELRDQPARHRRREQRLAAGDHPHGVHQILGRGVLEQEPAGPRAQRLVHVVVQVERGEDEYLGPVPERAEQPAGRREAVQHRHPDVHEHDVGVERPGLGHGGLAVRSVAHHEQVGLRGEQRTEALPHHRLVVRDQHLDHSGSSPPPNGRTAVTV